MDVQQVPEAVFIEPSATEYVCKPCSTGNCARCKDHECECCYGNEGQ